MKKVCNRFLVGLSILGCLFISACKSSKSTTTAQVKQAEEPVTKSSKQVEKSIDLSQTKVQNKIGKLDKASLQRSTSKEAVKKLSIK